MLNLLAFSLRWKNNRNFADLQFCFKISKVRSQLFFLNLIIHKPSLGSCEVSHKIWARSVQPFWRLLDTIEQTDRQAKYKYRFQIMVLMSFKIWTFESVTKTQFLWAGLVQSFWRLSDTNEQTDKQSIYIDYIITFSHTNLTISVNG